MDNLTTKQSILMIGICVVILAALNVWGNSFKQNECVTGGGKFIKNTSDSTLSMCLMGE